MQPMKVVGGFTKRFDLYWSLQRQVNRLRYHGSGRYCPVCGYDIPGFNSHGLVPRPNAKCPVCNSLERHRLLWLYLTRESNLFTAPRKKLLHIAPELLLSRKLKKHPNVDYLSGDLYSRAAMVRMDITAMQFADDSFDAIICYHVLEHVPDDRRAIQEMYRVLKPGGWALVSVPLEGDTTYEDPSVTDPRARERHFGQHDHVRQYGRDISERLAVPGFDVEERQYATELPPEEVNRMGLRLDHVIFAARKPSR